MCMVNRCLARLICKQLNSIPLQLGNIFVREILLDETVRPKFRRTQNPLSLIYTKNEAVIYHD